VRRSALVLIVLGATTELRMLDRISAETCAAVLGLVLGATLYGRRWTGL
jgi:hypothetical protein